MNPPDPIEEALSFAKYIPSASSANRSTADEHVIILAAEVRRLREVANDLQSHVRRLQKELHVALSRQSEDRDDIGFPRR